ncbi:3-hydroxyisobutyrate dehydrogenase [Rhodoblastus acidophilus]|uniref:3-hydroxyisobutyrate dehydrogenase n=1 Tax=Rhodoblastus acidophilus TaxID=1074 RepID=A0A212R4E6_RHOAC|nr:3-hydroxyisobutyrate dehydrogenase [Rhodoblastus acidophilus]PPQ36529.1 3-hydroxyisobutyrate dehydrogenase [Rhodoblastus acidophilus]RAI16936.1 3-hydroxyisobutyrate dehydrogenase [Rhodoblastus acidophilus]SNB66901.1 3-hydroxyisobutyrate dehydrogenase [Rhodoblastus acidophilus]
MTTIAFIGLGNMGGPMAVNLAKADKRVLGFDFSAAALDKAREGGVEPAPSGAAAAEQADVIVTMLPAGKHLLAALDGDDGLLRSARKGALLIDCSTVDMDSARAAHDLAAKRGLKSVDAPVSGGVGGATAATLTFMVGGADDAVALARPILEAMGKKIVHCGGPGAGQAAKICNNMILGVSMIAVSEAFVLGEKLGLSHQALFDVASTASGQCWSLTSYCPVPGPVPASPANRDYAPGFATALMLKDLNLSQAAAQGSGASTPLGRRAAEIFAAFANGGGAEKDFSGIIEFLRGAEG